MIDAKLLRHRRPWRARLVLAIVLVGFAALAVRVAVTLVEPDLLEQKIAGAERYLYYRVTPTSGPSFQLDSDLTAIRLVTHVVVPPGHYDPALELEYGIRIHVVMGDQTWDRDIYTRSRQSKARPAHGMWLDENTFVPESTLELTDDRLLSIALPSPLPAHATIKVTLLGDVREGYVRAYAPAPRDDAERFVRDLPDRERSRIAAQIGYVPWDRLREPEDLAEVRYVQRRLSAEGKEGSDYQTRTLFTTGFRLRTQAIAERGLLVTAMRGAAINVVGPAHVELAVTRPAAFAVGAGQLDVALVGETPVPPTSIALPTAGATSTRTIDVPAGVHTLTLLATAPARVEVTGTAALGNAPLAPDEQATTAYVVDPTGAAVEIALDGPPDLVARVLRFDVRALASTPVADAPATTTSWPGAGTPPLAAPPPPGALPIGGTLTIETLDDTNAVIATATAPFESPPSRFEVAKLPGKLAASVCEPVGIRFVVPLGGVRVRVRTDHAALVQVSTPIAISPPPDRLESPYDAITPVTTRWRYARYLERGWLPVRAHNHAALDPDRVALVLAQARLEPRVVPPVPEVRASTLAPDGAREQQTLIERIAPADAAEFVARWDAGRYTRLVPGDAVELDLGRLPSRPTIRYRTDDVGSAVTIEIDGVPHDPDQLSAARGTLRLPSGLAGTHTVRVQTTAKVELLVDRPPVKPTAELYALRTVSAIGERRVRLKVTKKAAAQQNIDIIIYTTGRDSSATARILVDGGSPARVGGIPLAMWTLADRTVPLPPPDRPPALGFADAQGGVLYPHRLVVALGDDVGAGTHTIDVTVAGANLWTRAFTLDDAPVAPRALQWREATEEAP